MNERFVAMSGGFFGNWGCGDTMDKAMETLRKAGGQLHDDMRIYRFTAKLPFAPADRDAADNEADCWVGSDGAINWIRCDREKVTA